MATVLIPISRALFITRNAISPLFATKIFFIFKVFVQNVLGHFACLSGGKYKALKQIFKSIL
jgi:hypothetical protein